MAKNDYGLPEVMTAQAIYDKVVGHLFRQGRPSMRPDGMCLYRGPNGTACAVGCLIDDDDYHADIEKKTIDNLLHPDQRELPPIYARHVDLLRALQNAHDFPHARKTDGTFNLYTLYERLYVVATRHKLDRSALAPFEAQVGTVEDRYAG